MTNKLEKIVKNVCIGAISVVMPYLVGCAENTPIKEEYRDKTPPVIESVSPKHDSVLDAYPNHLSIVVSDNESEWVDVWYSTDGGPNMPSYTTPVQRVKSRELASFLQDFYGSGENKGRVYARDKAGNETSKEHRVVFGATNLPEICGGDNAHLIGLCDDYGVVLRSDSANNAIYTPNNVAYNNGGSD